ncbi:MAG: DUF3794 domain-containing protein [Oscillospiraceae bacterium]
MELNLKKAVLDCYEPAMDLTLTQEETAETIVPDSCPDIARIIDTEGKVFLHSRELRDGKAELSGTVKITVLYLPDGEEGIRTLDFAVPFTASGEGKATCLVAEAALESVDSRLLNPRKILTRCRLISRLTGYQKQALPYCGDVVDCDPGLGIEKRLDCQHTRAITQLAQKDFTFSDELTLSAGKETIDGILLSKVRSTIGETKVIGSKLVVKGIFFAEALCRTVSGQYSVATGELPFSQILELEAPTETADCQVLLQATGMDFQLNTGDKRTIDVTLYLHTQAILREERELTLLTDLYSTAFDLTCEAAPLLLSDVSQTLTRRQSVRETLEIGVAAKAVLSVEVTCGAVTGERAGNVTTLHTTAHIRALYLDENDVPLVSERRVDIAGEWELAEDCPTVLRAVCGSEIAASVSSVGIEVRFPVDFFAEISSQKKKICLTAVKVDTDSPRDFSGQPSLVLRTLEQEEQLWDLAKRYGTTIADILAANELESEAGLVRDKLLLIPRKRC